MKLNIAENIRKLRRNGELTQEQLAEKLGVSFQTVSRWENGVVYPDIELLPTLAELFDITVDELMGCGSTRRDERFETEWNKYCYEIFDPEECYLHLKKMHAEFKDKWWIHEHMLRHIYDHRFYTEDLREIVFEVLNGCTDNDIRHHATLCYVAIEDDEHIINAFLKSHVSSELDKTNLLRNRYYYRGEWDKYDIQRKRYLFYQLIDMFSEGLRVKCHFSPKDSVWAQKTGLALLNTLCEITPTHPVSGDGEIDLWIFYRVYMGLRLSCALASSGDIEKAYEALEDVVELCEKFVSLPDDTELSFRCYTFGDAKAKIKHQRYPDSNIPYIEYDAYDENTLLVPLGSFEIPDELTREHGWEWFDPIRDDDRYKALVRRLEKAQEILEASV